MFLQLYSGLLNSILFTNHSFPTCCLSALVFLIYLGYKISKTKVDLEQIDEKNKVAKKRKERGGFWTGFLLNFLNPTLFLGWLTSSFIIISIVSALGFNTGGLDKTVDTSFKTINKTGADTLLKNKTLSYLHLHASRIADAIATCGCNGFTAGVFFFSQPFLCLFSFAGQHHLVFLFGPTCYQKYRNKINIHVVNRVIQILGIGLCFFGLLLGYKAITMLV